MRRLMIILFLGLTSLHLNADRVAVKPKPKMTEAEHKAYALKIRQESNFRRAEQKKRRAEMAKFNRFDCFSLTTTATGHCLDCTCITPQQLQSATITKNDEEGQIMVMADGRQIEQTLITTLPDGKSYMISDFGSTLSSYLLQMDMDIESGQQPVHTAVPDEAYESVLLKLRDLNVLPKDTSSSLCNVMASVASPLDVDFCADGRAECDQTTDFEEVDTSDLGLRRLQIYSRVTGRGSDQLTCDSKNLTDYLAEKKAEAIKTLDTNMIGADTEKLNKITQARADVEKSYARLMRRLSGYSVDSERQPVKNPKPGRAETDLGSLNVTFVRRSECATSVMQNSLVESLNRFQKYPTRKLRVDLYDISGCQFEIQFSDPGTSQGWKVPLENFKNNRAEISKFILSLDQKPPAPGQEKKPAPKPANRRES